MFSACSGSKPTTSEEPRIEDYEDFDPSAYPDRAPIVEIAVEHDIPEVLTDGAMPVTRNDDEPESMAGFRIQVAAERDRPSANRIWQSAERWWNDSVAVAVANPETEPEPEPLPEAPVYIEWDQPLWKVRMGNFRSRNNAQDVLDKALPFFPGAFVVPSMIVTKNAN